MIRIPRTRFISPAPSPTPQSNEPAAAEEPPAPGLVERVRRSLSNVTSTLFGRHSAVVVAAIIGTMPLAATPVHGAPLAPHNIAVQRATFRTTIDRSASGAYFRKISSAPSRANEGIKGTVLLPTITLDPTRNYLSPQGPDDYKTGSLDRPSVYVGGRAQGHELDAGLTWDRVYDATGRATYTDRDSSTDGRDPTHRFSTNLARTELFDGTGQLITKGKTEVAAALKNLHPNFAFRPYYRTTNNDGNDWHQPKPNDPTQNLYYYPGETVTLTLRTTGKSTLTLDVGAYSTQIHQTGFGTHHAQSFKRVNSIDQFYVLPDGERRGREGQDVLPTRTTATGATWQSVELLRARNTIPMQGTHFTEIRGRDTSHRYTEIFKISAIPNGGEKIDITPGG